MVYFYRNAIFFVITRMPISFTHLWNPIGFPAIWPVEGQYMQRAMSVLKGFGLHESDDINPHEYDHPFLGQFF
jgi:hypothetical protein